jgi:membrane protease YdiL (CAAX protease family)
VRAGRVGEVLAGGVLVAYHFVHGRGARHHRLLANVATAAAAVGAGRAVGLSFEEMGVAPRHLRRGITVGAAVGLPLAAAIALAGRAEPTRRFFADEKARHMTADEAAYALFARIPLETALAEEVLFRGVHLAVTRRMYTDGWAVLRTSLAFGAWHVPPALRHTADDPTSRRIAAAATDVAVTSLAGIAFARLRLRSGSVVAPAVVHAALNGTALAASYVAHRRKVARAV